MIANSELADPAEIMALPEQAQRIEMCRVGRWMYRRGLIVAGEGNLSARLSSERILITPAGACKGMLTPKDLLVINPRGEVVAGSGRPSSETRMHLAFYRLRPDVRAVCHAHPPQATGFAVAGRELEAAVLPEVIQGLGTIPLAPYATPGTFEVSAALEPLIPGHEAILLQNYGVVTCGRDLRGAYFRLETVEQFARILAAAHAVGGPRRVPRAEMHKLVAARARDGTPIMAASEVIGPASQPQNRKLELLSPGKALNYLFRRCLGKRAP
jgi:L-fuculose-phosphate aldolase